MSTPTRPADLSPAHIDRLRSLVGDNPIPTPDATAPCQYCGQAWPVGDDPVTVTALTRLGDPPRPPGPRPELDATFTTCGQCQHLQATARAIIRKYPSLPARFGPHGATVKVEAALMALTVLGKDLPTDATPPHVVGSLVARLGGVGSDCAWSGSFAPVMTHPPGTCSPRPWSGVPQTTRLRLRQAYAGILADRVATSRPEQHLTPPDPTGPGIPVGGADALCGIGHVTRSAADVAALGGPDAARREVWTPITVDSRAIGGPGSPQPLAGWICGDCRDALESVGSVGQTAMLRAFVGYLRRAGREQDALKVERGEVSIVGWAAVSFDLHRRGHPTPAPNTEPWGHLQVAWPA